MPALAKVHGLEQHKPAVMTIPATPNKAKRKRRESDGFAISPTTCKPSKRKSEYMSHVEVARRQDDLVVTASPNHESCQSQTYRQAQQPSRDMNSMDLTQAGNDDVPNNNPLPRKAEQGMNIMGENVGSAVTVTDAATMTLLQEIIESQFGLEILLKHNELRLIDQEIAKCQVALEQLRRCQLIPYPTSISSIGNMQAISGGDGPSYGSGRDAPQAAPWGVTDGPYSRHYAKWLIPDPIFDGDIPMDARPQRTAGKRMPERTTRGSKADKATPALKSRSQRGSAGSRLQALPAGYPEPKEEKGPMIVKRSTDGRMVKLVCLNCRRENFNSAQGFINHCRIAHGRGFASHDAAALACGEEVEFNEAGGVISDSLGAAPANAGLVHPLIRSALAAGITTISPAPKRRKSHSKTNSDDHVSEVSAHRQHHRRRPSLGVVPPSNDPSVNTPFVPSSSTPHLSALFAKIGRGGNLNEFVTEATTRTEVDLSDEDDGDYEMEDAPEEQGPRSSRGVLHGSLAPTRATMSPAPLNRTTVHKGVESPPRNPGNLNNVSSVDYASPYHTEASEPINTVLLSHTPPLNLSPNTIESNPAPSLVSDDEDDYEDPHSDSEAPSSEAGDPDEGRYVVEVEDEEEVGGSSVDPELATAVKARAHPPSRRRSVLRAAVPIGQRREQDTRRVSFRSPTRDSKPSGRKRQ
ncbi:hypothetical protein MMC17_007843 [Xylographa soralifera]|nr:hypothetical protein [Xylographa soralifera]